MRSLTETQSAPVPNPMFKKIWGTEEQLFLIILSLISMNDAKQLKTTCSFFKLIIATLPDNSFVWKSWALQFFREPTLSGNQNFQQIALERYFLAEKIVGDELEKMLHQTVYETDENIIKKTSFWHCRLKAKYEYMIDVPDTLMSRGIKCFFSAKQIQKLLEEDNAGEFIATVSRLPSLVPECNGESENPSDFVQNFFKINDNNRSFLNQLQIYDLKCVGFLPLIIKMRAAKCFEYVIRLFYLLDLINDEVHPTFFQLITDAVLHCDSAYFKEKFIRIACEVLEPDAEYLSDVLIIYCENFYYNYIKKALQNLDMEKVKDILHHCLGSGQIPLEHLCLFMPYSSCKSALEVTLIEVFSALKNSLPMNPTLLKSLKTAVDTFYPFEASHSQTPAAILQRLAFAPIDMSDERVHEPLSQQAISNEFKKMLETKLPGTQETLLNMSSQWTGVDIKYRIEIHYPCYKTIPFSSTEIYKLLEEDNAEEFLSIVSRFEPLIRLLNEKTINLKKFDKKVNELVDELSFNSKFIQYGDLKFAGFLPLIIKMQAVTCFKLVIRALHLLMNNPVRVSRHFFIMIQDMVFNSKSACFIEIYMNEICRTLDTERACLYELITQYRERKYHNFIHNALKNIDAEKRNIIIRNCIQIYNIPLEEACLWSPEDGYRYALESALLHLLSIQISGPFDAETLIYAKNQLDLNFDEYLSVLEEVTEEASCAFKMIEISKMVN